MYRPSRVAVSSVVRMNVDSASRPKEKPIFSGMPSTPAKRLIPLAYTTVGDVPRNESLLATIITVAKAMTATSPSTSIAP